VNEKTAAPITPQDFAEGENIDFQEEHEPWCTYKLADGTTLKVKLVLVNVLRLKKYSPDGTPIYLVNSQNVVRAVNVPKELKEKLKKPTEQYG
jgi:hypothetical protein